MNVTTDVDEIANGPARQQAYGERCCWMASCNWCNCHQATDKAKWPIARKLAKKWLLDREHFDLEEFNAIRRGQPQVSWPEVTLWICRELDR